MGLPFLTIWLSPSPKTYTRNIVRVLVESESVKKFLRYSKQDTVEVYHVHAVNVVVCEKLQRIREMCFMWLHRLASVARERHVKFREAF